MIIQESAESKRNRFSLNIFTVKIISAHSLKRLHFFLYSCSVFLRMHFKEFSAYLCLIPNEQKLAWLSQLQKHSDRKNHFSNDRRYFLIKFFRNWVFFPLWQSLKMRFMNFSVYSCLIPDGPKLVRLSRLQRHPDRKNHFIFNDRRYLLLRYFFTLVFIPLQERGKSFEYSIYLLRITKNFI